MIFFGHWPCLLRRRFWISRFRSMSQTKIQQRALEVPPKLLDRFQGGEVGEEVFKSNCGKILDKFPYIRTQWSLSPTYCSRLLGISPELIFIFLCCFQMCRVNDSLLCIPGFLRCAVAFEWCGARAPFKQDIRIKCSIRDAVCLYLCLLPGFVV